MDVLYNIIWYIFKDNGKFNPKDCLKAVVSVPWLYVPRGYLASNRFK